MSKKPDNIGRRDMREAYLMVNASGNSAPIIALLMVFFFVFTALAGNPEELVKTAFRPGGNLLTQLQLIAGATVVLTLITAMILKVLSHTPQNLRVQTFRNSERLLYNLTCCALVCVGLCGGLQAIQERDVENRARWEQMEIRGHDPELISKARTKDVVISLLLGLPLVAGCGALLWWSGRILFSEARTFWQHVRLTAYFDQEVYAPGETVMLMLKDRQSFGSSRPYRLQLSYIRETSLKNAENEQIVRGLHHTKTWPVTAGQLHDGFRFALPDSLNVEEYSTRLSTKPYPCYWEVLIEEADSHFYCRFFVDVQAEALRRKAA